MTNNDVTEILKSAQKLWAKWRDNVPPPDSDLWIEINHEVSEIIQKYGKHLIYKEINGRVEDVEEWIAGPIVFWFLDEMSRRSKEGV